MKTQATVHVSISNFNLEWNRKALEFAKRRREEEYAKRDRQIGIRLNLGRILKRV